MQKRFQHSVLALLLISYLFVGVMGHFQVVYEFFGLPGSRRTLTESKPERPVTSKVYWTQYKHIPAFSRIVVPSPAALTTPCFFHQELLFWFINLEDSKITPYILSYSNSSRAPPVS